MDPAGHREQAGITNLSLRPWRFPKTSKVFFLIKYEHPPDLTALGFKANNNFLPLNSEQF